jgi:fibronectin-binding autotransporter adhesin
MRRVFESLRLAAVVGIAATFLGTMPAAAAVLTWSGSAGATWDISSVNWNGGGATLWDSVNGPVDVADFNTLGATPSVSGTIFANGITFANTATVSGGTITLSGASPTITSNANATIGSLLTGTSGLTTNGPATLTLSAANTYSGGTNLNAGTLVPTNNSALGSGTLTLNGGTLGVNNVTLTNGMVAATNTTSGILFNGNNGATLSGVSLTGSGVVNFTTNATAQIIPTLPIFSGFNGTIGIDTSAAGNIFFPSVTSGAGASWVVTGGGTGSGAGSGSFLFTGASSVSLGALSGNGRVGSSNGLTTWSIGALNTNTTFSGVIINNYFGGTAAITKVGSGSLTLTGKNPYTGETLVTAGTLAVGGGGLITSTGTLITQSGCTMSISNGSVSTASGGAFGDGYGAAGAGTVLVGSGGSLTVGTGGGLTFVGGGPSAGPYGTGTLTVNSGGLVNVAAPGAFPNERLYMGGYGGSGVINISGGTLATARDICQNGTVNFNGGTLRAASGYTFQTGILSAGITVNIQSGGATIDSNGSNVIDAAALLNGGGGGGLTKVGSGTLTISAASTYTGPTTINAGTLLYNTGNGAATYPTGTLTVNSGGTLTIASGGYYELGGWSGTGTTPVVVNTGGVVQSAGPGGNSIFALNNLTLAGGNLNATGGWTSGNNWGAFDLFGTLTVTANSSIQNITGVNNFLSPGSQNGNQTLTISVSSGATLTENLPIENYGASNTYSITKAGAGSAVFTAANTYSGATTVTNGVLSIAGGGSIQGTGTLITQTGGTMSIANGSVSMSSGGGFGDGYGAVGTGTVVVGSGGTLNVGTGGGLVFVGGGNNGGPYGTGTLTVGAGGLVNIGVPGAFPSERLYMGGYGGTGYINVSGGTLSTARDLYANTAGTMTLNGAYLQAASGYSSRAGTGGNGSGNGFLGGTLLTVYLQAGGVTIDSNGNSIVDSANMEDGGGGGLTKVGSGMLTLSSNNTTNDYIGNTLISAGTLNLTTTPAIYMSTLDTSGSGMLTFGSPGTYAIGGLTGPGNINLLTTGGVAFNFNVGNNGQNTTYSGNLSGGSNLTKIGTGTLTLSGSNNTVSGFINVLSGTLNVAGGGVFNGAVGVYAQSGGSLNVSNGTITMASNSGGIFGPGYGATGIGTMTVGTGGVLNIGNGGGRTFIGGGPQNGTLGAGILNINSGGLINVAAPGAFPNDQIYLAGYGGTGTLNLNGGTLSTARSIANGGASTVNFNGGTLQATASSSNWIGVSNAYVLSGGAIIDTQGYNVTIGQSLLTGASPDGGLTKVGSGTLTLGAANTYNGGTTLTAGYLIAATNTALGSGTVALNGGTLAVSGAALSNNVTLNGGAVSASGNGFLAGTLSGSSGLTVVGNGVLTLSGTNTYNGPTLINGGTLRLAGGSLPAGTRIMPVGDSITYGVNGTNAGYRGFLYSDLIATGNSFQFVGTTNGNPGSLPTSPVDQTYHDGWPGWTSAQISSTMGAWLTQLNGSGKSPTIITMMIGTNDPPNGYSVSQSTANIASIINTAYADVPGVRFLLAQVTPRTDNNAYNAQNSSLNAALVGLVAQDQASGDNIALVDLNTNFPADGLSSDNLHPNDTGYSWMASQWTAAILAGQASSLSSAIPANSPTTVAAGATFDLAGNPAAIGPLSGAGSITLGNFGGLTVVSTSGNSSTFSGTISGAAGVTKAGPATLTLNGSNTYSGATMINAGSLAVGPSGSIAASPTVNVAAGAIFDVTAVPGGYIVPAGQTITGAGTVSVAGGTALTLNGGAALSGGTSGVGALTVNGGTLTFNTGSALNVSATAPGANSFINVTGALNLASNGIAVNIYQAGTSSAYNADGTYTLATYASLAGSTSNLLSFSTLDLSKLYNYSASSGSLTVSISDTGVIWTGNSSLNWSDSGNWSTSAAPVNGQVLIFAGSNTGNNNDIGSLHAGGLQFNPGAASFNLAGGSIQLSNGLTNLSGNPQTIGLNVVLGNNLAVYAASPIAITGTLSDGGAGYGLTLSGSSSVVLTGSNTYSGTTTINSGVLQLGTGTADGSVAGNIVNNTVLSLQPATTITLNGAISGLGTVAQLGPGSVVLAGSNSYSGATNVYGGTLTIPSAGALNSGGGISVSAAVLNVNGAYTNSGAGLVQVSGGGVLNFNGAGIINGTTSEVWVGNNSSGTLNMPGGSLVINSSGASGAAPSGGADGTALAGMRIGNGSGGSGVLNFSGGLLSVAGGDEFYVGYNSGTGSVTVSGGTLSLGAGGGRIFIGGGDNGGGSYGTGTFSIGGSGLVTVAAGGTFPNEAFYLAGYGGTGVLNLNGGTLSLARNINTGGNSIVNFNGGTLQASASNANLINVTHAYVQAGGAIIDTQGYNVSIGQALITGASPDGGLTKVGTGTLTLRGANTYNGSTTINAGTLTLSQAGNPATTLSGTITVNNGATLAFGSFNELGGVSSTATTPVVVNAGGIVNSSATVNSFNNLTLAGGTLNSTGGYIPDQGWGSFALFGTLNVTANSSIVSTSGSNNTLSPGVFNGNQTLTINVAPGATLTENLPIKDYGPSNTYAIAETGSGSVVFTAANTYSGGTIVSGGTLVLANLAGSATGTGSLMVTGGVLTGSGTASGNVSVSGGALAPGGSSIGTMGIGGNLNLAGASNFRIDTTSGTGGVNDAVAGIQSISYGGTLMVTDLARTASYSNGETWDLFQFSGAYSGSFSNAFGSNAVAGLPTLPANLSWQFSYSGGDLYIARGTAFSGLATWTSSGNTSWSNSANWLDGNNLAGVPGLSGSNGHDTATFSNSASQTSIDLTGVNPNLAALSFSASNYTLSNGSLTLQSNSGTATVTVSSGTQTIGSALFLASSVDIAPAAGSQLTISGNIQELSPGQSLTLSDNGTLILSPGAPGNGYTGGTFVNAGTLVLDSSTALADGSSLIVGQGASVLFAPASGVNSPTFAATYAVAAVPEPGTLALLAVGMVAGFVAWRRRR